MGRGNGGDLVFRSVEDRLVFLGLLDRVARRCGVRVLAYCLMGNHFHLLVEVGRVPLGDMMRRLLSRYAKFFNRSSDRRGHLFQSRYLAKACLTDSYYAAALRYIHRNPVEAGLAASPGEWAWSSHRQFMGGVHSTLFARDRALSLLGGTPEAGRRRYIELMEEVTEFTPDFDSPESGAGASVDPAPSISELAARLPDSSQDGGGRRPRGLTAFRRALAVAAAEYGYSGSEIAAFLNVSPGSVSRYLGEAA